MINIQVFGPGEIQASDGSVDRVSLGDLEIWRTLQLLAVHRTLSADALADLLWNGDAPAGHTATLAAHVAALNFRLGPVILRHPNGYALDTNRVTVDLWDFDDLLRRARGLPPARALVLLERALGLAGQLPLTDQAGRRWAAEIRDRYRARLVAAATTAARYAVAMGAITRAAELAALATDLEPAAEDAWRLRMSILYKAGERAAALHSFHACRQILADERGTDPAPATAALFRSILRNGDRRPAAVAAR